MATPPHPSIDGVLSLCALGPGQTVTLTLVKGPTSSSSDPIAARRAAAASAAVSGGRRGPAAKTSAAAAPLGFPRVAKFPETVSRPDFSGALKDGRMYEEDVPTAKDESDEEDGDAPSSSGPDGSGEAGGSGAAKAKKRRWRRHDPRPRHWVLQEKTEFLEKMAAKRRRMRQQRQGSADAAVDASGEGENRLSSRYEGNPESNPSHYILFSVAPSSGNAGVDGAQKPPPPIAVVPVHGFHSFAQPAKFDSLSMREAEDAIGGQRARMTRYVMHGRLATPGGEGVVGVRGAAMGPPPKAMAKARLLGKLAGKEAENDTDRGGDDDDVMGDLAFRNRRGGSAKARRELLSLADDGITVDDEGVLGGTNDSEFGGRRRFGRVAVPKKGSGEDEGAQSGQGKARGGASLEDKIGGKGKIARDSEGAGNDGMAMQDDFYQRDVSAEYEDLDYDADELFDDDDVAVGENEIVDEGGFAGDVDDEEDADDEYDADDMADSIGGIATAAGFKAMLAKSRGEATGEGGLVVPDSGVEAGKLAAAASDHSEDDTTEKSGGVADAGSLQKVMDAAKKKAEEAKKKKEEATRQRQKEEKLTGVEVDESGRRLITLEAIRKEIWLHHGTIKLKRLMKIFTVKGSERQEKFRSLVNELCTMKKDKVEGNILVLKQHYSKSG